MEMNQWGFFFPRLPFVINIVEWMKDVWAELK
jgi:hypothetical protein